jgi:hypothetical protein
MTASICGLVTKSAQHVPLQAESAEAPITEDITTFVLKGIQERLHSPALDGRPDVATARIRFTRRRLNPLAHDAATHQPPEGVLQAAVRKLKEKVVPGSTAAAPPRAPGEGFVPRDVSDPLQATAEYRMEFAELALLNRRSDVALEELASLYRELPWWTRLVNQYAMTLAMTGQVRSARAVADESVRRFRENGDPCPVELVLLRGELSLRANEYVAALHDAEEAVAHGSRQSMTAQLFRINCYGALGRMDEAYEMASSLIARRPISRKAGWDLRERWTWRVGCLKQRP